MRLGTSAPVRLEGALHRIAPRVRRLGRLVGQVWVGTLPNDAPAAHTFGPWPGTRSIVASLPAGDTPDEGVVPGEGTDPDDGQGCTARSVRRPRVAQEYHPRSNASDRVP